MKVKTVFSYGVLIICIYIWNHKVESTCFSTNYPFGGEYVQYTKRIMLFLLFVALALIPFADLQKEIPPAASNDLSVVLAAKGDYALLSSQINQILQDDRLKGTSTGVSVRKASTGEVIYEHFGDTRLHPASNMKLLTGAAALETLGENYRFTTEVLSDGKIEANVLQGNLYLKGKGDPTLLKKDFDHFAQDLKAKGIQKVNGSLIGDDTWYDKVRLSSDITWTDESYYYAAQVSALTASPNEDYDAGSVIVEAYPNTKEGKTATVKITPETDVVNIINISKTGTKNSTKDLTIERQHGKNNIIIKGTVPIGGNVTREWIAVWEPSLYALNLFGKSLQEHGIQFSGKTSVTLGKTPAKAFVLTSKKSMTLKELFIPFMKLSNNGHAEVLAKEMGKVVYGEGSWEKGLQVIEDNNAKLGLDMENIQLRDASGMSHLNLIPANEVSKLLFAVQKEPWYNTFLTSLPVAGNRDRFVGGSLRNRINISGNVRAKTGYITAVSALSGYAVTKDGELMIFSILINNYLKKVTPIEDQIVTAITSYSKIK
jgi:D-alanyl-D-alanine carboxypeptidase/D-alanyl-D-alanine-endopeptidase (penicillin-binding protein 4)